MKLLLLTLLVLPVLSEAQIFSTNYNFVRPDKRNRSLYVRTQGLDDDLRDVMNMYTTAVGVAVGTQISWNPGSLFFRNPLPAEGMVTQSLKSLAKFDHYLTNKVRYKINDPKYWNPVVIDWIGMRSTRDYVDRQRQVRQDFERQGLKKSFDVIAPFFNGTVRQLPDDFKTNAEFITEAHSTLEGQIRTRFPTPRQDIDFNITDNFQFLANSYTPLMMTGHIEIFPKNWNRASKLRLEFVFPRIGELVAPESTLPNEWYIRPIVQRKEMNSPPIKIDEISLGKYQSKHRPKNFAIKVIIEKDFSKPYEMDMTLEFGQLKTNSTRVLAGMDFGEVEEGLVARGKMIDNEKVRVRLSFQRLAMKLNRPRVSSRQTVENNYQFDFTVNPKQSIKSVAVDVPQDNWYIRAKSRLGMGSGTCDSEANICSYAIYQIDGGGFGPLNWLLMGFVNKEADKSVQAMIPGAILDADKSVASSISSLLQQVDYGLKRLEQAYSSLNELPQ